MKRCRIAVLVCMALAVGLACAPADAPQPRLGTPAPEPVPLGVDSLQDREIYEPQMVVESDGTLLLIWREKGPEGFDLFSAARAEDGVLGSPSRINDHVGTVYSYPHDEMRPAVATAADDVIAVVWTDERAQIRSAISRNHGASWEPSIRLDQADGPAYRSFTAAAFDARGDLHAIWIDSRFAPQAGAEEPADLFYARVSGESVTEVNLTELQAPSICGCCKPDVEADVDGSILAVFRNAAEGHRDIYSISGSVEDGFSTPVRVGDPLWELQGCPMAGPITAEGELIWMDASTGEWVLMRGEAGGPTANPVLVEEETEWRAARPPRIVAGSGGKLLLVPGKPYSRLLRGEKGTWLIDPLELPVWATTAALAGTDIIVVGAADGALFQQTLRRDS